MGHTYLNLSASVGHRIWQILHQQGWLVEQANVPMKRSGPGERTYVPAAATRPWLYVGVDAVPWPSGVVVRDGGRTLGPEEYAVDYIGQRIILGATPSGSVAADLACCVVNVRAGYPDEEEQSRLTEQDLPIVAYEVDGETAESFAIGSAAEWRHVQCSLSILGRADGELKDLMDDLRRRITWLPLYKFNEQPALTEAGGINGLFSLSGQCDGWATFSQRPRASMLPRQSAHTRKERHEGLITFTCAKVE
jgi:hypothetical protein